MANIKLNSNTTLSQIAARQAGILTNPVLGAVGSNHSPFANTISITGPNNYSNDLTLDWFAQSNNVKKYEVFETTEDVLALSVTWHRLRPLVNQGLTAIKPTRLTDEILFNEMTQEDRDRANDIRDYYSKKLMMLTLKEQPFTNYRKDLSTFIHGNSKLVKEEMMPLIYRLPEFYDYDIETDVMFRDLNTRFEGAQIAYQRTVELTPIKKFTINHKHGKRTAEYWLKDERSIPYKIDIDGKNELLHLWDTYFEKESVKLHGAIKYTERDGIGFNKLIKWTIEH